MDPESIQPQPGHVIDVFADRLFQVRVQRVVRAVGIREGDRVIDAEEGRFLIRLGPPEHPLFIHIHQVVGLLGINGIMNKEGHHQNR